MSADGLGRIAAFVEHFPPYLGSDKTIYELTTRSSERGVDVHFIATQPLRFLLGKRPEDWSYAKNWPDPPSVPYPNLSAEYLLVWPRMRQLWDLFPPLAYLITVVLFTINSLKTIIRFRPNVIVAAHASPILGVVASLTAKLSARPLIIGCPDWMSAYAADLSGKSLNSLGPIIMQFMENTIYRISDGIFTTTHFLKRLLCYYGIDEKKITVIPNGVDITMFRPDIDASEIMERYRLSDHCVILFTGHLEEWAGINLIYDLALRLGKEYPKSVILLVGSGDRIGEIFSKLSRKNLSHMLVHAGVQPFEKMPQFNAAADIALCLFPNTPVSHAASPLKLFEYMGAGKAIVATDVTGTSEVLEESAGILVSSADTGKICSAVVRLCKNNELRNKLGKNARKLAEDKYSWNNLSKEYLTFCKQIYSSA